MPVLLKANSDLMGMRFGRLSVVGKLSSNTNGQRWECLCDCGNTSNQWSADLRVGRSINCGCNPEANQKSVHWTGCGDISGTVWNSIRGGAKSRKYDITITIRQAWELFLQQDRRCALSGATLSMMEPRTASLDRIDNNGCYQLGNVQWLHRDINMMKRTMSQGEFVSLCKLVAAHAGKQAKAGSET